jgi:hypothetical protein
VVAGDCLGEPRSAGTGPITPTAALGIAIVPAGSGKGAALWQAANIKVSKLKPDAARPRLRLVKNLDMLRF